MKESHVSEFIFQQSKMLKIYSEAAIFVQGNKILSTILLVEILTSQEDNFHLLGS